MEPSIAASEYPAARRAWFWSAVGVPWTVLVLGALTGFSATGPWDDAYMFARYADNVLRDRTVAWNPGGEPIYGLTSLLFLALVVPLRLIGGSPALALVIASSLAAVGFGVLLTFLLYRRTTVDRALARALVLVVFGLMAMSVYRFAPHIVSGMDTTLALAFVTGYVVLLDWHERHGSAGTAAMVGLLGALSFSVRPDLLAYGLGVPFVLFVFAPSRRARRQASLAAAVALAGTALELGLAWTWLGSPIPLSFYAKSRSVYGVAFSSHYWLESLLQLGHYLESYWMLVALLGGVWILDGRGWWRRSSPGEKALVAATLAFVVYHATQVTPIMGMHQRFYYPTLPALAFMAGRAGAGFLLSRCQPRGDGPSVPLRFPSERVWWATALVVGLALLPTAAVLGVRCAQEVKAARFARFDMLEHYRQNWRHWWFRLDAVSALPDDLVLSTSEIGLPAALNPRKSIVDLAGLNQSEIALPGFSVAGLVARYRPDVVYLPHPHYRDMIEELLRDSSFVAGYDYFAPETLGTGMGLAVRRDGRHAAALQQIVSER